MKQKTNALPGKEPIENSSAAILYAEDDPVLRHCVSNALSSAGYLVRAATNGQAAWEILRGGDFDLLVTDNLMPELTGVDLVVRMRTSGIHLPIIVVSSELAFFQERQNHWLNVNTVRKPFTLHELKGAVRETLCVACQIGDSFPFLGAETLTDALQDGRD